MQFTTVILSLAFAATSLAQSQIPDGQVQVPTDAPAVTQIADGQIQAPTDAPAVNQIPDGQIQAPTDVPAVTQIPDGQIQAPTATDAPPVTQIADGQIQVGTSAVPVPSANGTFTTAVPSPSPFTGGASLASWNKEIVVAAIGAAAGFALL